MYNKMTNQMTEAQEFKNDIRMLSERPILSRIFKEVIPEFQAVSLKEIEEQYIGDDIRIGTVPVGCLEPDGTEATDEPDGEDSVAYDILVNAKAPGEGEDRIIISVNLILQGPDDLGYPIERRALYYSAAELSAQLEETATAADFENLHKSYAVFIVVRDDIPNNECNTATLYSIEMQDLTGTTEEDPCACDLMSAVVINVSEKVPSPNDTMELIAKMLGKTLDWDEKLAYLKDHGIQIAGPIAE